MFPSLRECDGSAGELQNICFVFICCEVDRMFSYAISVFAVISPFPTGLHLIRWLFKIFKVRQLERLNHLPML